MTDSETADSSAILKTDTLGRTHTKPEQRNAILDEFERSGLSGPQFAEAHGIHYQTFASWRQKRRRERGELLTKGKSQTSEIAFLEVAGSECAVTGDSRGESSTPPDLKLEKRTCSSCGFTFLMKGGGLADVQVAFVHKKRATSL